MVVGLGLRSRRGRMGADAERRDHLYCNSGALRISLSFSSHRARCATHFLSIVPFFVFHFHRLLPAPILTRPSSSPHLCFTFFVLFAFHVRLRRGGGEGWFPFYALVKYFPWFCVLLFVRILLSGFSLLAVALERHSLTLRYILRVVSFITETSDFCRSIFSVSPLLFSVWAYLSTCKT